MVHPLGLSAMQTMALIQLGAPLILTPVSNGSDSSDSHEAVCVEELIVDVLMSEYDPKSKSALAGLCGPKPS